MIDIVIPEHFKDFFSENMRILVFGFILSQIAIAYTYVFSSTRGNALLQDSQLAGDLNFKGLRFNFKSVWDYLAFGLFVLLLALFGWLLFDNAELCMPDQAHITGAMHGGLWMQIVPQTGRFSPMLHQEFLIFGKIFESTWSFYLIAYLELLLLCIALLIALPVKSLSLRLLLIASLVFSYGFQSANSALICPEVHIVFGFLAFMYFASKTKQSRIGSLGYFCGAGGQIFLAAYLIYLKEPIFLVLGSYSIIFLVYEYAKNISNEAVFKKFFIVLKNRPVEFSILCISIIYAVTYFIYIFLQTQERYGSKQDRGIIETALQSVYQSPLVGLYFLLLFARLSRCNKQNWNPVWDSLTISFIFYYFALIAMGMVNAYYYVPIALMAILLAAKLISNASFGLIGKLSLYFACIFIVAIGIQESLFFFRNREFYMTSRKLAAELLDRLQYASSEKPPSMIYFLEENEGYDTGQFVSYINYSSSRPATFQMIQENHKKPNAIPVIPIAYEELTKLKRVPAGAVFIGLPNLGGGNVKIDRNQIPDWNTVDEIVPWNRVSSWKKKIYSLASKPQPQNAFQGVFISK